MPIDWIECLGERSWTATPLLLHRRQSPIIFVFSRVCSYCLAHTMNQNNHIEQWAQNLANIYMKMKTDAGSFDLTIRMTKQSIFQKCILKRSKCVNVQMEPHGVECKSFQLIKCILFKSFPFNSNTTFIVSALFLHSKRFSLDQYRILCLMSLRKLINRMHWI